MIIHIINYWVRAAIWLLNNVTQLNTSQVLKIRIHVKIPATYILYK